MLEPELVERTAKLMDNNVAIVKDGLGDIGELTDAQETAVGISAFWLTQLDLAEGKTGND